MSWGQNELIEMRIFTVPATSGHIGEIHQLNCHSIVITVVLVIVISIICLKSTSHFKNLPVFGWWLELYYEP